MSEQSTTLPINAEQEVELSLAPLAPPRPSLARKRAAVTALALNVDDSIPVIGTRVPSSLSLSSEFSTSDSSDEDNSPDSFKRSRHDSTLSVLSDESDSQSSLSSEFSYDLNSSSRQVGGSRREAVPLFVHNSIVGDYKIVGAGREAKAVHMFTNEVYDCRALTEYESLAVTRVICRLDNARTYYHGSDIDQLRNAVFPNKAELVEELNGRVVLFTPVYQRTLHSYAQQRGVNISEAELKPIFEQIIRLIAFCHTIGIILRDLKPRKLVFDKNGAVRLAHVCDCVVCDDPENDVQQETFGSPAYIPPEVLHRRGYSGRAADIWGLGVLFYLLLLGRYPFYDQTPVGVFQKIKQARVVIPPSSMISRHARVLLYNLLKKCPNERPTAEELKYIPWAPVPRALPSRGHPERLLSRTMATDILSELTSTETSSDGRSAVSSAVSVTDDVAAAGRSSGTDSPQSALEGLRTIMMSTRNLLVAARAAMNGTAGIQAL